MPKMLLSGLILAASIVIAPLPVQAQDFPSRPIKIIVPNPPGGAGDISARVVAQKLSEVFHQGVVVENQAGASGTLGLMMVKRAAPDGYTIGIVLSISQTIDLIQNKKRSFDLAKDFSPITAIADNPSGLLVNDRMKAKTMAELIEEVRAKPGFYSYGSAGVGTGLHLSGEKLKKVAGLDMINVPYKGVAPAFNDLLGGHVPIAIVSVATAVPHLDGGKVRMLTVFDTKRHSKAPAVPTIGEVLPKFVPGRTWIGFLAPPNLPAPIVARLHSEIVRVLKMPDVVETLGKSGLDITTNTPEEFGRMIHEDAILWDEAAVIAGLVPEGN